jgi:peptidoglycan hydrolase-like protein with peptidoglycan-binding domain
MFDSGLADKQMGISRCAQRLACDNTGMYFKTTSAVTLLIIGLPFLASALTTAELQQQVQGLKDQVTQLQQSKASSGACPTPGKTMKRGSSGTDVTLLQQFLARDKSVYPEGAITGTYGPLTETAVKRFQAKNGIASSGTPGTTGYGAVGPRTAKAIADSCAGASSAGATNALGGFIAVAPYSGGSSRAISVQVTVNAANSCSPATYTLDYGDRSGARQIPISAGTCKAQTSAVNHTYQLAGTYQVTLSSGSHSTSVAVAVN